MMKPQGRVQNLEIPSNHANQSESLQRRGLRKPVNKRKCTLIMMKIQFMAMFQNHRLNTTQRNNSSSRLSPMPVMLQRVVSRREMLLKNTYNKRLQLLVKQRVIVNVRRLINITRTRRAKRRTMMTISRWAVTTMQVTKSKRKVIIIGAIAMLTLMTTSESINTPPYT